MIRHLCWVRLHHVLLGLFVLLFVVACDVPKPPPEQLTPAIGSVTRTPLFASDGPTPTPEPLTLPPTGRLWFVRGGRVWTAAPDGSGVRAVSTSPATAPPAPAPDGAHVAFLSDRKLLLLDSATGAETTLAEGTMATRQQPTWSPDGRQIGYFTLDTAVMGTEIAWAVPPAGGPPVVLTRVSGHDGSLGPSFQRSITWAGDMRRVAVSGPEGPIQVLPLDSTANPLTVFGGDPDWSPDFRTLLLAETLTGALVLHDTVSDDRQPYRNEKTRDGTRLNDEAAEGPLPRFNGSGSLILYRAQSDDKSPAVGVRARDGSEFLFLPSADHATWAPDGQWIVYETGGLVAGRTFPTWQPNGITRIRADGSGQAAVLPAAAAPAWSR